MSNRTSKSKTLPIIVQEPHQLGQGILQKATRNRFGVIATHSLGPGGPMTVKDFRRFLNGPFAAIEKAYQAELKKPAIIDEAEFMTGPVT